LPELVLTQLAKVVAPDFEIEVLVKAGTGGRQQDGFSPLLNCQFRPPIDGSLHRFNNFVLAVVYLLQALGELRGGGTN
jgi:hypothetical protein